MKHILLFGAGKSATCLIDYLIQQTASGRCHLTIVDNNPDLLKTKVADIPAVKGLSIPVENEAQRHALINTADIVISLLPPAMHYMVAQTCVRLGKNLLTASYIDENIRMLEPELKRKNLLFLCEMGLDPGIDHMSSMKIIHRIKASGGEIHLFRSHTGGLVAPESDDNPWHYKISWNPRNVVMAGVSGAIYKEDNITKAKGYPSLFEDCAEIAIPGLGKLAYYPNRDSLGYIPIYALESARTFIRTTLRYPIYCQCWKPIAAAGLTSDTINIDPSNLSINQWASPILPYVNHQNIKALSFLGLFEEKPVPATASTNADVLQYLLETKLAMQPSDKDMIVMLHELGYTIGQNQHYLQSSLIVKGENSQRTAMAKTVGLPLGIAAMLILEEKIKLRGLHIPILPEIYEPVLRLLEAQGIEFKEHFN